MNSRSIIIKNKDFRESDKLITLFSEKKGKLKAVAKGIKKPNSSLRACVQPFCHSVLFISEGKDLDLITQGKIINFYGNLREDFQLSIYSIYIMELLDKSLMDKVALPKLYLQTLEVLNALNENGINHLYLRYYELQLLVNLGYMPIMNECVICGTSQKLYFYFSLSEGGAVCNECFKSSPKFFNITGETFSVINILLKGDINIIRRLKVSPTSLKQLEVFLEKYLEYHLERRFNMKNTIKLLKNSLNIQD